MWAAVVRVRYRYICTACFIRINAHAVALTHLSFSDRKIIVRSTAWHTDLQAGALRAIELLQLKIKRRDRKKEKPIHKALTMK